MSQNLSAAPAWARAADRFSLFAGSCLILWRFFHLHAVLGPKTAPTLAVFQTGLPHTPAPGVDWWSWWDQSWYLESALAWARLDTDPALHWYPPGYPMLGALFTRLTQADPFMIPNLLCLLAAFWLFASLAAQVLGRTLGRSAGAWVFLATTVLPQRVLWAWVVPWTTTPETVCLLICLLGTLRFLAAERRADSFWAGFGAAATVAFRPADGAVVGGVCAAAACWVLWRRWPGRANAARIVGAALAGAALPALVFGSAYLAVNGPKLGGYLVVSGQFGFEWRLLPLRWITLVIDPKPVFVAGEGLAHAFPWIVSGLAGMAALVLRPPAGSRVVHVAVTAGVLLDTVLFLCYRDLHPTTLWHNGIYHYFKWTLPFFGLYSLLLLRALLLGPRLVAVLSIAGVVPALFMWRLELAHPVALAAATGTQAVDLPRGLSRIDDALVMRVTPDPAKLGAYGAEIHAGSRTYQGGYDFWTTTWADMLMVQPLRPMAAAPSTLVVPAFHRFDVATAPVLARQTPVWGVPCWVHPERLDCQTNFLVPAPDLALGHTVRFGRGRDGEVYIMAGVSVGEPEGDWTDGRHTSLSFRLPPATGPLALEMTAYGFVPEFSQPVHVTVFVNGVDCARWRFGQDTYTARAAIPAAALRADGNMRVSLVVSNPRSPADTVPGSADMRQLGVFLEDLRVDAAAPGQAERVRAQ